MPSWGGQALPLYIGQKAKLSQQKLNIALKHSNRRFFFVVMQRVCCEVRTEFL
jgi:hypothetical protein